MDFPIIINNACLKNVGKSWRNVHEERKILNRTVMQLKWLGLAYYSDNYVWFCLLNSDIGVLLEMPAFSLTEITALVTCIHLKHHGRSCGV